MLKRLGIETWLQLAVTLCVFLLIGITPIGSGGPAPVLFAYRSLLLAITILCLIGCRRQELRISPWFLALVGLHLALVLISVLRIQGSHFEGFYLWYRHAFFICSFIALAQYSRYQSARWRALVLGAVVFSSVVHLLPDLITNHRPIAGFSNNENYFATFMLIGVAGSLAVVVFGTGRAWRIIAAASGSLLLFGIIQTASRGALIASAAALAVAAFRGGNRIPRQAWLFIGLVVVVVAVVTSPYLIRKFVDRGDIDPYNYARTQVWINSARIIAESPLLGVGFGQYWNVSKRFGFPVEGLVARYLKRAQMAHSEYLQYMAENGIPAAMLMFSIFGYLVFLAWKRAETLFPEYRYFNEAAILTGVVLATHALVDNCWTIPVMASGLVTMSLADLLPMEKAPHRFEIPKPWVMPLAAAAALGFALLYSHAVVIPALANYNNDAGHIAFEKLDLDKAEHYHLAAVSWVPDQPVFLDNLGMVYLQRSVDKKDPKYLPAAATYFARAIASGPLTLEPHIHMETVLIRSLSGDRQRDLPIHKLIVQNDEEFLAIDPFIPFARKNLAEALYQLGQRDRAFTEVHTALEYEPNYVPGYLQLAGWYRDMGNVAESDRYAGQAVAIVTQYRNYQIREPYEGILLARPEASWEFKKPPK